MKTVGPTHKTNDFVAYTIPNCGYVPDRAFTLCEYCDTVVYFDNDLFCGVCFNVKLREEIRELLDEH